MLFMHAQYLLHEFAVPNFQMCFYMKNVTIIMK